MKSNGIGRRGFGRTSGTVTVLEARVHRSSARNAKVAFIVTALLTTLITMAVAADRMHPILALLLGLLIAAPVAGLAWLLARIWPALRLIWWWTPEALLILGLVDGWVQLARHTDLWIRLLSLAVLFGVPAVWPWLRRRVVALAWCLIVRHRLRSCFAEFIMSNQSGSLPLVFLAVPTAVGERCWIWLRQGLALPDLHSRLDKIAVACWADTVIIERASDTNAALLRIDVKRRGVLTAKVTSPLVDEVDPETPPHLRDVGSVPTALDLPDIPKPGHAHNGKPGQTEKQPNRRPAVLPAIPAAAGSNGEDVSDWI